MNTQNQFDGQTGQTEAYLALGSASFMCLASGRRFNKAACGLSRLVVIRQHRAGAHLTVHWDEQVNLLVQNVHVFVPVNHFLPCGE